MIQSVSQTRTSNYLRQIKGSFFFKGLAVAASFLAIPLMIRYLGQEQFGVWSTLLSVMSWIVFFDLGLGNGLRNKLAESIARNEIYKANSYVSSAYSLIGLISIASFALSIIAAFAIPWQRVFNTSSVTESTLRYTVLLTAFFIILNFWISLINQVLNAVQKTSVVVFGQFLSNAFSLILVFIVIKTTSSSVIYMAAVYGFSLVISNLLLSIWFYRSNRSFVPSFSLSIQHIQPLLSLGIQFFIIQIAALVIFTTHRILITQFFGPQHVTQYDVVFKLFSIITLIHSLITVPLWSSYTDAYHRGDYLWLKGTLKKQFAIFFLIVLASLTMLFLTNPIVSLWIGEDISISMPLVISITAFILISVWNNIFAYFVNGVGEVRPQLYSAIIAMLINIPIAIILTKHFGFGIEGVVWSTVLSLLLFAIIGPIQVYSILKQMVAYTPKL